MTFAQYVDKIDVIDDHNSSHRYSYVICSSDQARQILEAAPPRLPILILGSSSESSALSIETYLSYLSTKDGIDVHIYSPTVDGGGRYLLPLQLAATEAIKLFRDKSAGPVNFLNLDIHKQNEVPSCIAGLPAYSILRDIREYNDSGKRTTHNPADLTSCVGFHILGKQGVFSNAHVDHHGVMTTVYCDEGEKIWLTYPRLSKEEQDRWATSDDVFPQPPPFPIYLDKGSLLIQPAGQVHAPYSLEDVLMTGTMHWDSRRMVQVLQQSHHEQQYPKVTNEDAAQEFTSKLEIIERLWKQRHQHWPWGSDEDLVEFSRLLRVSHLRKMRSSGKW